MFKALTSLILLSLFITGQVSATTGNGIAQVNENISPAPALDASVLTCGAVPAGVTCTDYGAYLDYSININVTGLTGGATAFDIFIGSYSRSTDGGDMGMMSDFVHSEMSWYPQNNVNSAVSIRTRNAGGGTVGATYPNFYSDSGTNVSVSNKVTDWRYLGGDVGELHVLGDVNWPLTGYSIVGHIYLYSVPVLELTGIEVTQVVQDLNNSVPLIAYKPTYVRAYVRSLVQGVSVNSVTMQLSAYPKIFFT